MPLIRIDRKPLNLEARPRRTAGCGIDVINRRRPPERYLQALPGHGLMLTHFDAPPATGGRFDSRERYNRVPDFHFMAWRRPSDPAAL